VLRVVAVQFLDDAFLEGEKAMRRSTYNTASLEHTLGALEERYGMSSDEFYDAHVGEGERVKEIPRFDRHVWASFYREARNGNGRSRSAHTPRTLELA
jgi:hypothetical protein